MLFSGDPLRQGMWWAYTSRSVCLEAGTYTFEFDYRYIGCWYRTQYLDAYIESIPLGTVTTSSRVDASRVTAPARSAPGGGTRSITINVPYRSQWRWTFKWSSNDTETNAYALPCATCTPTSGDPTGTGGADKSKCSLNTNDIGVSKPRCISVV